MSNSEHARSEGMYWCLFIFPEATFFPQAQNMAQGLRAQTVTEYAKKKLLASFWDDHTTILVDVTQIDR